MNDSASKADGLGGSIRPARVMVVCDPVAGHATVRVRGLMFRPLFERAGWTAAFVNRRTVSRPLDPAATREQEDRIVAAACAYDAVYLLKVPSLRLVELLKSRARVPVVFDLSDTLWKPVHRAEGWQDLEGILAAADAVFAENDYIGAFAARHNGFVRLVPDSTPVERFERMRGQIPPRPDGRTVIGWVGSPGTVGALRGIQGALQRVFARHPGLVLRVAGCGLQPPDLGLPVSVRPDYDEDGMIREVLGMDVGLYPPPGDEEDYLGRGGLKAMVYMSGGVPPICLKAGECASLIEDGVTGMLVERESDWEEKLERLVSDPPARAEMGRRAREAARSRHSPEAVFRTLTAALREVIDARGGGGRVAAAAAEPALRPGAIEGRRIVMVLEYLEPGGAELQALALARQLKERHGARVEIWGFMPPGRIVELCAESGIPWRHVPFRWSWGRLDVLRQLVRLGRALRSARPDVILPYTRQPNVACGLVWRWSGARVVAWNQRDAGMELTDGRLERRAVDQTPLFLSNSRHAAEMLTWRYAVPPDRVRVVPNGIELEPPRRDRADWRRELGVPDDAIMATMVANLHRFKDHETVVDAWALVARALRGWEETEPGRSGQSPTLQKPAEEAGSSVLEGRLPCRPPASPQPPRARPTRAVLVLAGRDGGMTAGLKQRAFDRGLSGDDIRFPGQVDDVPGLLAASDLAVFSSRAEGCPNAILECMASGLAVAATDIPGIREAVGDDYEWLAPAGDAETLARRVLGLIGDPAARRAAADGLKQRAERVFGVQQMADRTAAILAGALADAERKAGAG